MLLVPESGRLVLGVSNPAVGEVSIVQPDRSSCCYTALNATRSTRYQPMHGKRYRCVWPGIRRFAQIGESGIA